MNSNLAPIILFVYNRPNHTLKTLISLSNNYLADKSNLYIFSDGPPKNSSNICQERVASVREILTKKKWCGNVQIIEYEYNKGLSNSIINGISKILNEYGKIIVLEDDIITSEDFLIFMNYGLDKYKDTSIVKSVSGYLEPIKYNSNKPFFIKKGTSWGWGTWARVWNEINFNEKELFDEIVEKDLQQELNFAGYPYFELLKSQLKGEVDSWGIKYYVSCFLKDGLHFTPPKSLVKNIGFDSSGIHCGDDKKFEKQKLNRQNIDYTDIKIHNDSSIENKLRKFYSNREPSLKKFRAFIKSIYLNLAKY